jgi:hypothetical protein
MPAQQVVDRLVGAVVAPLGEVVVRRALGRQIVGEVVPLDAGSSLVADGVDDLTQLVVALVAADGRVRGLPRREHGLDQRPLRVG